ncbi:hypothetical protein CCMA1212_007069 [Trichoderma ghanense]|uniref:Uncharacterized protein n=1 Tax=Trichoderma ghanense TaxID=65468 RepID=A0ABY2GZG7_9HYPO
MGWSWEVHTKASLEGQRFYSYIPAGVRLTQIYKSLNDEGVQIKAMVINQKRVFWDRPWHAKAAQDGIKS